MEISYATPLPGAFTKPIASKHLGDILDEKNIKVVPEFYIERVDPDAKKIVSYDEIELEYDLLVTVPLNMGAEVIGTSGLGDDLNFITYAIDSGARSLGRRAGIGDRDDIPRAAQGVRIDPGG